MKEIRYNKILVTHDGSKLASLALPYARSIALACGSEIVLLHVTIALGETLAYVATGELAPPVAILTDEKALKAAEKVAHDSLQKIKSELEKSGVSTITMVIEQGNAGKTIVDVAKKGHCDLVIMSSHGRSGLGRALLGSTADYAIHHAPCPVMIVRSTKKGG
jgi:nucleotide-binding universal stress UspA family protein